MTNLDLLERTESASLIEHETTDLLPSAVSEPRSAGNCPQTTKASASFEKIEIHEWYRLGLFRRYRGGAVHYFGLYHRDKV